MKELKEALSLVFSLGEAYEKSVKSGGGFSFLEDFANFFPALAMLIPAVSGSAKIPAEVLAMDEAARDELIQWAKAEFDLEDDGLEEKVEKALAFAITLVEFLGDFLPGEED